MLLDVNQLNKIRSQAQNYSDQQYCQIAVGQIAAMLDVNPMAWHHFGPYWPLVQELFSKYRSKDTRPMEWGDPPSFLSQYQYGSDVLNAIAALTYLNRDGDYLAQQDDSHSIDMPDGSQALYLPGVGIVNTGD